MTKKVLIGIILMCLISAFSLALVGQETEKVKAFRDINFGESKRKVLEKIEDDVDINIYSSSWEDKISCKITLQELDLEKGQQERAFNTYFKFYRDKLYLVNMRSPELSGDDFSSVKDDQDWLVDLISHKYGQPSWERHLYFFEVEVGYVKWTHIWDTEDTGMQKKIKIGLGEVESWNEDKYTAEMNILYPPLKEKAENEDFKGPSDEF